MNTSHLLPLTSSIPPLTIIQDTILDNVIIYGNNEEKKDGAEELKIFVNVEDEMGGGDGGGGGGDGDGGGEGDGEEEWENNNLFYKLELLSTFLNGQKEVYLKSKNIMNFRQNTIMITCILISCLTTILSINGCEDNVLLITTILNSFVTFLIGLSGIFKFDAIAENYLHISDAFNKLEMHIENCTSKIQSMDEPQLRQNFFFEQIDLVEQTIGDMKDKDNIPKILLVIYPLLTNINIFSYVLLNKKSLNCMRFDQKRFERRSFDISHLGEKYPKDENRLFFQRLNGITDNYTNEKLYYINSHDIEEGITMIEDLERKLSNEIKMANRYWWGGYYFVRK